MTAPIVTLYTAGPSCMPCVQTKRHLTRRGIPFTEISLDDDPNILAACTYLGFTQAPVVFAATTSGEQSWAGYRPDRIDALAADLIVAQSVADELVAEMAAGHLKLLPSAADLASVPPEPDEVAELTQIGPWTR